MWQWLTGRNTDRWCRLKVEYLNSVFVRHHLKENSVESGDRVMVALGQLEQQL